MYDFLFRGIGANSFPSSLMRSLREILLCPSPAPSQLVLPERVRTGLLRVSVVGLSYDLHRLELDGLELHPLAPCNRAGGVRLGNTSIEGFHIGDHRGRTQAASGVPCVLLLHLHQLDDCPPIVDRSLWVIFDI